MAKASSTVSPEEKPAVGSKAKAKPEPVANVQLVKIFEKYDESLTTTEGYFIELIEFITKNEVDRATVVISMMKARDITYESAQSQYSRLKGYLNNEEVLKGLKDGTMTLKVAREKTKKTQVNPASAKPEAKEQKFNSTLKAFSAAAKESGHALKEIMVTCEAELKSAGIK